MNLPQRLADATSDPYADLRSSPRVAVALPAFLMLGGRRYPVQIIDLSAGGAKLDIGQALVAEGATVTLDWGGAGGLAVVRWRDGRMAGVAFVEGLDERNVAALAVRSEALAARMRG